MVKSKYEILSRDFFTCRKCGAFGDQSKLQIAHGIMQARNSGMTIKYIVEYIKDYYGDEITRKQASDILNDEQNVFTTCSLKCNDSYNIFYNPEKRDKRIRDIYEKEFKGGENEGL